MSKNTSNTSTKTEHKGDQLKSTPVPTLPMTTPTLPITMRFTPAPITHPTNFSTASSFSTMATTIRHSSLTIFMADPMEASNIATQKQQSMRDETLNILACLASRCSKASQAKTNTWHSTELASYLHSLTRWNQGSRASATAKEEAWIKTTIAFSLTRATA